MSIKFTEKAARAARKRQRRRNLPEDGPRPINRKEARAIARANMERAGVRKINRHFSANWLNYIPHAKRPA